MADLAAERIHDGMATFGVQRVEKRGTGRERIDHPIGRDAQSPGKIIPLSVGFRPADHQRPRPRFARRTADSEIPEPVKAVNAISKMEGWKLRAPRTVARRRLDVCGSETPAALEDRFSSRRVGGAIAGGQRRKAGGAWARNLQAMNR